MTALLLIDFTRPEEGFVDPDYGGDALKQALIEMLPEAYAHTFRSFQEMMSSWKSLHDRQSHPMILCAATMAATAGMTPVPWIDLPVVSGLQFDLVRRLAKLHQQEMDVSEFLKTLGAVAAPTLLRHVMRAPLKLIPGVGTSGECRRSVRNHFRTRKGVLLVSSGTDDRFDANTRGTSFGLSGATQTGTGLLEELSA